MKREPIEGQRATANFERTMKKLFQVPKSEIAKKERREKGKHGRRHKT